MSILPAVAVFILHPEAHAIDLLFVTTSLALRRREWELEHFEVDQLGFPNELSNEDYNLVLHLHGTVDHLDGGWLPQDRHDEQEPMEPVEAGKMQDLLKSLSRAGLLWLQSDESRDAAGQHISGLLAPEPKKAKKHTAKAGESTETVA